MLDFFLISDAIGNFLNRIFCTACLHQRSDVQQFNSIKFNSVQFSVYRVKRNGESTVPGGVPALSRRLWARSHESKRYTYFLCVAEKHFVFVLSCNVAFLLQWYGFYKQINMLCNMMWYSVVFPSLNKKKTILWNARALSIELLTSSEQGGFRWCKTNFVPGNNTAVCCWTGITTPSAMPLLPRWSHHKAKQTHTSQA